MHKKTGVGVIFFQTDLYSIILGQSGKWSAQNENLRKTPVASGQYVAICLTVYE